MKNQMVELKDGRTRCRIIDAVLYNGNTMYLVVDFKSKSITLISPKEIWDIVEKDRTDKTNYVSLRDIIIETGI